MTNQRLLIVVALSALLSLALPWWHITMHAPQYPDGLTVTVSPFSVSGNVAEIDELNHYIGFRPLETIATRERSMAWLAIPAALLPLLAAFWLPLRRFAWLAALPFAIVPPSFVGDMIIWMWYAGHHLDPHAALSSSVSPWTPHFLGPGGVGQFKTFAMFDAGFALALIATACTVVLVVRAALRREHQPGYDPAIAGHAS